MKVPQRDIKLLQRLQKGIKQLQRDTKPSERDEKVSTKRHCLYPFPCVPIKGGQVSFNIPNSFFKINKDNEVKD